MGSRKGKMIRLLICLCLMLSAISALRSEAAGNLIPSASDNLMIGRIHYSKLVSLSDGYMRVFYNGVAIGIEYYDDDFNILNRKNVLMELPLWGGFYAGADAYYLIEGQNNTEESNTAEVIRVIKYGTDWSRKGAASITGNSEIFGGEIRYPFDTGCVEMTETGGKLYIVMGHEGYVDATVGQGHQGYLMIEVDESTMTGRIADADLGHSFYQYIASGDSELYVLEQKEGSRCTALSRYNSATMEKETIPVLKYGGYRTSPWAVACYATVNGIAMSGNNILCVGTSIDQSLYDSATLKTPYNIYLTVTPMSDFTEAATQVKWITDYKEGGKSFPGLKITRVNDNRFMLSWEEYNEAYGENGEEREASADDTLSASTLHYVFVNGEGDVVSKEFTEAMSVSDCQPVVKAGKVEYYASSDNMLNFYSVNADTGAVRKRAYRVAGENVTWELHNGVLTISGSGVINVDSDAKHRLPASVTSSFFMHKSGKAWEPIQKLVNKIVVEEGIIGISDEAFTYFENLEEVELKQGLVSIGSKAFYGCNKLDKITIPSSVTSIGDDFLWTGYLWTVDDSHVVRATIYAPYDSYVIAYAKANGIKHKSDLSQAKVSGLDAEYEYTGENIQPEVTVTLGGTILKAEKDYKLVCKNNVEIGTASVEITGIGDYYGSITGTFAIEKDEDKDAAPEWTSNKKMPSKGKTSAKGTVFTDEKTGIQYKVTKKAKSGSATVEYKKGSAKASNVSIPATVRINGVTYKVTSIGTKAFAGNKKLRKVTIGKNITSIGKQAFYNCKNLRSIIIKTSSLKSSRVGSKAFKGIYKMAIVKVPAKKLKIYGTMLRKKGIGSRVKLRK